MEANGFIDEWGPEKIIIIYDQKTKTKGIVVIDNSALGPGKGGIRLVPDLTVTEVFRLARVMTWKNALAELPFGGGKSGIKGDPKGDKASMLRAFGKALKSLCPVEYLAGPDMNTGAEEMRAFVDGAGNPKAATGKPTDMSGLPHELGSTGFGVAESTQVAAEFAGIGLNGTTVAIEGFGNVGTFAMKFLSEKGAKIVAVSDSKGTIYEPNGLNYDELMKTKKEKGTVLGYPSGKQLPTADLFGLDVSILIPGARPDVITEKNVNNVKAKIIVEAANIPVKLESEAILHGRGVTIVPDLIANAGGVLLSYTESIGGTKEQAFSLITERVRKNTKMVLEKAKNESTAERDAAMSIAKERVLAAMAKR
ncbi:Glu/Leu/Phe/Val dehydrogenase [Candidatus Micrarchaeota archaeon]|nr:Glu/Leu/Phe/Val dehydrogenase [Candidatus Micrarchaeota archaeon]